METSPQRKWSIEVAQPEQMEKLAWQLSGRFKPGDFVALTGALGVGKTTFTQYLCKALGVKEPVTSPTFVLLNQYWAHHDSEPTFAVWHGDLYRLDGVGNDPSLDELEEVIAQKKSLVLVEWADLAPQLQPQWTWHIDIQYLDGEHHADSKRLITLWSSHPEPLEQQSVGII